MDKITIIPGSVRGYGDVVSPKTIEDFEVFDAELSFEDGLYTLVYDASGVSVGLSVSSSTISVGESVVLTAEVLSAGEPASGETVSFYDGNTLLGTDETDSDGIATYTASSLGVGSHSLTAEALDKSSSAVTVTVNKLTSTITISVPSTGTVGTSYTVSGTLVPTSGSVKLYENSVLKDTLTVTSGSFSKAITQSNEGTYSYYAVFEGSSTYSSVTSSTGSIVVSDVPTPVVTSVSLSADKSILSYADSESATLSATVLDSNDDPMEGVTVTFYNGSTSMGTADTNSSGVATKSYASSGVGDVSFTASVGTLSSETYSIEDAIYFNDMTSVPSGWTIPSSANATYSSNGMQFRGSGWADAYLEVLLTKPYSVEFDLMAWSNNPSYLHYFWDSTKTTRLVQMGKSNTQTYLDEYPSTSNTYNNTIPQGSHVKIEINETDAKLYVDDELKLTKTYTMPSSSIFGLGKSSNCTTTWKNIKIKPL